MWDGFVLCCQRLKERVLFDRDNGTFFCSEPCYLISKSSWKLSKAKCAHILLSLPEMALLKIIQTAPDLNTYLATYLGSFYFTIKTSWTFLDQLDQTKRSAIDPYFTRIVQQHLQPQTAI